MIVYISIGNSDDKLSQVAWSTFIDDVHSEVECWSTAIHGRWYSAPDSTYQNACWCAELTNREPETLKKALTALAGQYGQDSIAWAEAPTTEFLGGAAASVAETAEKTNPMPAKILALPILPNDADAPTVRDYLVKLLQLVWRDGECFDGKRPFGNSSWEYELYAPLVKAGLVRGALDRYGDVDEFDRADADELIAEAIQALGATQ